MWEEGVTEWYQGILPPSDWMGYVLVMHAFQFYVFLSHLHSMFLLHLHDGVHGCSDVTMLNLRCYRGMHRCECMNGYMLIYVAYMYHFSMFGHIPTCLVTFLYAWLRVSFLQV